MNRDFMEEVKHDFSFLNISDDTFDKIFNRCIDPRKTNEENKKRVYKILYKMVNENIVETGSFIDIENYIEENFDLSTLNKCIESLNKLSIFLTSCNIEANGDNCNKILKSSEQFEKCLKSISLSKELTKEQKYELLNEKAADILDIYDTNNNSLIEVYSDIEEISEEELNNEELLNNPALTSDALRSYLNEIGRIPLLTPEEEYRLTKLYRETHDKKVKNKIIESNLRLVVSVAKKLYSQSSSLTLLDLISAGNDGLFRALEDYDPDQARFTTYAKPWIYQRIRREIHDNSNTIRVPVHVQEKMSKYNKKKKELEGKLGREPSVEEIKKQTGLSYGKINEYENNISKTISLHTKILTSDRDSSELGDFIADSQDVIPEEIIINSDKGNLDVLFEGLSDVEKMIMLLRTGIYDQEEHTLDEIAVILYRIGLKDKKLTRERVRQLELKAMRKIKRNKENYDHNFNNLNVPKTKEVVKPQVATLKDAIILLRTTDKDILYNAYSSLSDRDKIVINECFGMDIVKAELKKPSNNMIEILLENIYPRLLYEINRRVKSKRLRETVLPRNIYKIDDIHEKDDVEKQIDILQPFERLILNKFYDIYTGELRNVTNITMYEKEQIALIIEKVKKGLFEIKKSFARVDNIGKKNTVTRNNLYEYFCIEKEEDKIPILAIIESLDDEEIVFLKKWYGEDYNENPKDKVDFKDMDRYERTRIFNKIKVRLEKYRRLIQQGKSVDIYCFIKGKYVDRRSKDNIYTYFENDGYVDAEITQAISELNDNDKVLLREYYGSDLRHPIINGYLPEELKKKVLITILKKIQNKLDRNRSNKILRKTFIDD